MPLDRPHVVEFAIGYLGSLNLGVGHPFDKFLLPKSLCGLVAQVEHSFFFLMCGPTISFEFFGILGWLRLMKSSLGVGVVFFFAFSDFLEFLVEGEVSDGSVVLTAAFSGGAGSGSGLAAGIFPGICLIYLGERSVLFMDLEIFAAAGLRLVSFTFCFLVGFLERSYPFYLLLNQIMISKFYFCFTRRVRPISCPLLRIKR